MKDTNVTIVRRVGVFGLLLSLGVSLQAQDFKGNYPIGVEGIKAGSIPPPGIYLRDYNLFYASDRLNNRYGDEVPVNFDVFVYAQAPRPIWITPWKVLGANYGMDAVIPFVYQDVKVGAASDSIFGLGDIAIEPLLLGWHWARADLGVGYGFWAPTGKFSPTQMANTGQGFWGHMLTLGGTVYADAAKTWAASALARYEINHEQPDFNITPGNALSLEFGISKTFAKFYDVGVVGYWAQQTTKDSGVGASTALDSAVAIGPEINILWPKIKLFTSLRYNYELMSESRPQGHTVTLTLTKIF